MCPLLCRLPGQAGHNASAVGCPVWGCAPLNQIHTCCRKKIKYWNCLGIFSPIFPFSFLYFFYFWRGISKTFHQASLQCSCRGAVCVTHHVQQAEIPSWPLWEGELCKPQPNSLPCSMGCGAPLQRAGHDPSWGMGVLGMPDPTGLLIPRSSSWCEGGDGSGTSLLWGSEPSSPHTSQKSHVPLMVPCTHSQQQQSVGIRAHELFEIAETLFSHFQILSLHYHVRNVLPAQCQLCRFTLSKQSSDQILFILIQSFLFS